MTKASLLDVKAVVVTVSDRCFAGEREDVSGPLVARLLEAEGAGVYVITVPDEIEAIAATLEQQAARAQLIVTTGGTGLAKRDVTPEATRQVCDRLLDGLAERMRSEGQRKTPLAVLSRGVCGTISSGSGGQTLVVNLPGSPSGAEDSLRAALPVIPHALELLAGNTEHPTDVTNDGCS